MSNPQNWSTRRRLLANSGLLLAGSQAMAQPSRQAPGTVAAFSIRAPEEGAPQSLLIPGSHDPIAGVPPPDETIFDGRSQLLLEPLDDKTSAARYIYAVDPINWTDYFTPDQVQHLRALQRCILLTSIPVERLRPFFLFYFAPQIAFIIRGTQDCAEYENSLNSMGGRWPENIPALESTSIGGDRWLASVALRRGIPVRGLETKFELYRSVAQIPDRVWIKFGQASFNRDTSPENEARAKQFFESLFNNIRLGEFDKVAEAASTMFEDPADRHYVTRFMLDERNYVMADRLAHIVRAESVVAAIGAAHAGGPHGLPALMRRRGFLVEPIRLPAHAGASGR